MKSKHELAIARIIKELTEIIADNEQSITEILPDQRFNEALHYQIENSTLEKMLDRIDAILKETIEQ
jgi:hypothetical protein